tara:strand:+ start:45808 stop:47040 length:1233 start_codon:yes stop_codon:yes gene_type:complete
MKKIILSLALLAAASTTFAQSTLSPQNDNNPIQIIGEDVLSTQVEILNQRGTTTCADTNRWAWARSFNGGAATYYGAFMHADTLVPNAFGTYINVPAGMNVDVSGFRLYGWSLRPDGASVSVNAVLYAAGADSLPTGSALATVAVSLDTATGSISPTQAIFSSAVSLTGSFVISIENSTAQGDSISVLRGFTGSGVADNYPAVYKAIDLAGGNYTRLPGTSFGSRLPHYYPYVSYSPVNDFTMSVSKLSGANESVDFTYAAPKVTDDAIWSFTGFLGDTTSTWNFDDGSSMKARTTSHVFSVATNDYNVMLTDSIRKWTGNYCVMTETKTLLKAHPLSVEAISANPVSAFIANNEIQISNATGMATIYSITGSVVKQFVVSSTTAHVNVADLNDGIYILSVNNQAIRLKK